MIFHHRLKALSAASVLLILASTAQVRSGQNTRVLSFNKEEPGPENVRCLTGIETSEEAVLRHEYRLQQLNQAGSEPRIAASSDTGNIAVLEDDGTLILPANRFNLDHLSILFVPNAVGGYDALPDTYAFDTLTGNRLPLADDSSQRVEFSQGFTFRYFGQARSSVFVNSNGNLTFDAVNPLSGEGLAAFLGRVQISPFWDDLDPSAGDGIFVRQAADRLVITWNRIPEFGVPNSNTFQVVLFADGRIRFTYVEMSALDGLVGLAPGATPAFTPVRFRNLPVRGAPFALVELFVPVPSLNTVAIAQKFYQTHPDNFDVLTTWTNFDQGGAGAFYQFVKSQDRGIARRLFDNSRLYGSGGRMQGLVFMNNINVWPADPRARITGGQNANTALSILAQELGHRWLVDVRFNDNGVMSNELVGRQLAHWSFFTHAESTRSTAANPVSSSMEGNVWRDNGDGTFTSTNLIDGYSPMDQYLMGLRRPDEVPDFFVISDPTETTITRGAGPAPNVTVRGRKKPVSIRQIIEAEGPRFPDATNAPRQFRAAFIMVVQEGNLPSSDELERLDRYRTEWEKYFFEHTDGRATFDTSLRPARVITSINPSQGMPGSTFDAVITGVGLSGATEVAVGGTGVSATIRSGGIDTSLPVTITIAESASQGPRRFQVRRPDSILDSGGLTFAVSNFHTLATGLDVPTGLAVHNSGDVFVSNALAGTILRVTAQGATTVFARNLSVPFGLAFNRAGNLFVAENIGRISRIAPGGQMTPFVTGLAAPTYLAFDRSDNLFVLNTGMNNVVRIAPDGSQSVFATIAAPALFFGGLAIDNADNVYVSNYSGGTIFRFAPDGQMSTFARFTPFVEGMAFDKAGNLYVGNGSTGPGGTILRISPSSLTAVVSEASVLGPTSLATDAQGRLYAVSLSRPELLQFSSAVAGSPAGTPFIANIVPPLGPPGTTVQAMINGTGLTGATAVSITGRGVSATIQPGGTSTSLPITITVAPDAEIGARHVVVTTPQGVGESGNAPNFQFGSAVIFAVQNPPTITSITPSNPAPGQNVVITGTGFETSFSEFFTVVFMQGTKQFGAAIRDRSGNRFVTTVPTALTSGTVLVIVSRSNSPVGAISAVAVPINLSSVPAAPEITAITPPAPGAGQRVFIPMAGLPSFGSVILSIEQGGTSFDLTARGTNTAAQLQTAFGAAPEESDLARDVSDSRKSLLKKMLFNAEVEPLTQPYLDSLVAQIDHDVDPEVDVTPVANLQSGILVDMPEGLIPGPSTISARVGMGANTSPRSLPFQFNITDNPAPITLTAVARNVGSPGQLVALASMEGAGFSRIAQDNVVTFTQGNKSFRSAGISLGTQLLSQVPEGLTPGMAEVRLSARLDSRFGVSLRMTPPSNPLSFMVTSAPTAPSVASILPPSVPAGGVITITGTIGSFSPTPQDNTVTFVQREGSAGPQTTLTGAVLTANTPGSAITVRVPAGLKPGAVDISVSISVGGIAGPTSVPRRMTVVPDFVLNVPMVVQGLVPSANDVLDTAISLTNTSNRKATVVFNRFSTTGGVLVTVAAPVQRTLQPGEGITTTLSDLFSLGSSSSSFIGWLQIRSDVELKGNFFVFDRNLTRLIDGGPLSNRTSTELIFPHAEKNGPTGTNTFYHIVNPNDRPATVSLTETDPGSQTTIGFTIPPNGNFAIPASGPDRRGGFARARSNLPIAGNLFFGNADHLSVLNAGPPSASTQFMLSHFTLGAGYDTHLSLTNAAATAIDISIAAFDNSNRPLGSLRRNLQPGEQLLSSIAAFLSVPAGTGVTSGYLLGNSSIPGVTAFVHLTYGAQGKVLASSALEPVTSGQRLLFSGVTHNIIAPSGRFIFSGLKLLNPQNREAKVRVSAFDDRGEEAGTAELTLKPGEQAQKLLAADNPDTGWVRRLALEVGYVTVTSDTPIVGTMLVFTDDLTQLFAVPGQSY